MSALLHALALVPAGVGATALCTARSGAASPERAGAIVMAVGMLDAMLVHAVAPVWWFAVLVLGGMALAAVQRVRAARDRSGKHPSLAVHVAVGLIVTAGLIMLMPDMAPDASAAAPGATEASALSVADASHSHPAAETLPAALTLALMIGHTVIAAAGVRADRIARHRVHHIAMGCSTIAMGLIVVS